MKLTIETIPKKNMRYDTTGDWPDYEHIQVADMGNENYSFLVALHEMIEMWFCKQKGITAEEVDAFDMQNPNAEGDHPDSPYKDEHAFATYIEKEVADALFWNEYDDTVMSLKVGKSIPNTMSDENKANSENGGTGEAQQDQQPQGNPSVPSEGSDKPDAEHQEGGTPGSEGKGPKQNAV